MTNISQEPTLKKSLSSTRLDPKKFIQKYKNEADWIGVRIHQSNIQNRSARNAKLSGQSIEFNNGVMIEVIADNQLGYSATSNLTDEGLAQAFQKAKSMAQLTSKYKAIEYSQLLRPKSTGQYLSPRQQNLDSTSLKTLLDILLTSSKKLKSSELVISTSSYLNITESTVEYVTSNGTDICQDFLYLALDFRATAQNNYESQSRSYGGNLSHCFQIGTELLDEDELYSECERIGRESVMLLDAENCPSDTRDLLIHPDQMYMQIHESIGHPLELDRILGDERNYAGWSFIIPQDFGKLQYGSKLLNVTFDPTIKNEFASYAFDDGGIHSTKEYLIKEGVLQRGLGSLESQTRLKNIKGVANFRSANWNRAPIDRMANINIEPGETSLAEMISKTEKGIYMQSNRSWSIDDYRNKFQFGCEFAQLIEDGRLTKVIKNPNYRGSTLQFWNSLKSVGRKEDFEVYGSPYCGKGEPSQIIRVGHASPPCLFSNVEIFGGN